MRNYLLRARKGNEGFTLVELMIVVAIIGVLAALAIYGVSRYLKHSKTAEATRSLGAIETGSKSKYQKETVLDADTTTGVTNHVFCGNAGEAAATGGSPQPATIPLAQKMVGDYTGGIWKCLQFSLGQPQFYRYTYTDGGGTNAAATFTAIAEGNLDGNAVSWSFTLKGKVVEGESTRDGAIIVLNEDE